MTAHRKPSLARDRAIRVGYGVASGHHGEILQGVFERDGTLYRALLTLPCATMRSEATVRLDPGEDELRVFPAWRSKALRAAELTLEVLATGPLGGSLELRSNIQPRRGYGSSTSDVAAAIRAVTSAFGVSLATNAVARLAVTAEVASDSTVFGEPVLFAHREGYVIERYGRRWPPIAVLAFRTGRPDEGVETLELTPAPYGQEEIKAFRRARSALARAFGQGDVRTVGEVATLSAEINQCHLPTPGFERLQQVGRECGAAGIQVAHSGDVAGLLFDDRAPDAPSRIDRAASRLLEIGLNPWRFALPHGGWR